MKVFKAKESSGNPKAIGDRGKAWGLYQFHYARWIECGGKDREYRRADSKIQDRVMRKALQLYSSNFPKNISAEEKLIWIANWHNIGHGSLKRTEYAKDFLRRYHEMPN